MKDIIVEVNWKDIAVRASKTFVQTFLSVLLIADEPFNTEVVLAAVAAGISAAWNFVRETAQRVEFERTPEQFGEHPPVTLADFVNTVSDMYANGQTELALRIINAYNQNEKWTEEVIRKYQGMMGN